MLTGKQRSVLRAMANELPAIFQIGKGGINDNMIKQINDVLEARELIKATVLKNAEVETRLIAEELAEATGSELIQVIGYKFVLFKISEKNKTFEITKRGEIRKIDKSKAVVTIKSNKSEKFEKKQISKYKSGNSKKYSSKNKSESSKKYSSKYKAESSKEYSEKNKTESSNEYPIKNNTERSKVFSVKNKTEGRVSFEKKKFKTMGRRNKV